MSIKIVNDKNEVIKSYDSADEMFEDFDKEFKSKNPIVYYYDELCYSVFGNSPWFYFGYAPHVVFTNPLDYWDTVLTNIKWAYQRVVYGVDERASWGVGYWLSNVMPVILSKIKEDKPMAIPFAFFDDVDEMQESDGKHEEAEKKYIETVTEILDGFKMMKYLEDYEFDSGNREESLARYKRLEEEAKKKISLLFKYYWEIGT